MKLMLGEMKEKSPKSFKFPLLILECVCLFSFYGVPTRIFLARICYITSLTYILIAGLLQFMSFKGDVFEVIGNLEGLGAYGQYLGKVVVTTYQTRSLMGLMRDVSKFWKTTECTKTVRQELDNLLKTNLYLQKVFFVCVSASAVVCVIAPFIGRDLPFGVWNLEGYDVLYKITLVTQSITLPPIGMFLVAFDCTFLAFCIEITVQFRILCERFAKLAEMDVGSLEDEQFQERQHDTMKSCIRYHVFLLKFLDKFQTIYSPVILVEFLTITPIICVEMYALFESKTFGLLSRYGVICFTSILQLAFYCIPADYVTNEAMAVADAIYSSHWYYSHYSLSQKKLMPFLIQKSQKPFIFTAGGLFEINARTLLSVLKVSWSSCTVMRAIKHKS